MSGIFDTLSTLGITEVPDASVIYANNAETERKQESSQRVAAADDIMKYLYFKKHHCPVCDNDFSDISMRNGKCRFEKSDIDLRAFFTPYDPIMYGIVMCQFCGYSAMSSHFNQVSDKQADAVIKVLAHQFKYKEYPLELSEADARERYLMALLCATLKQTKASEKAMLCLRLSWFTDKDNEDAVKQLRIQARKGFERAYSSEYFPIYGMASITVCYLLGALCHLTGEKESAKRYISQVLVSRDATSRLKDKALTVKELLM